MRRGETDAARLLGDLLDRHERAGRAARRITAFPATSFGSPDDRAALEGGLRAAADAGAVGLEWDRDAPHLIGRVVLGDAQALYRHLGRTPPDAIMAAALAVLSAASPETAAARSLRDRLASAWAVGGAAFGFGPERADRAVELVRAADAAFAPSDVRLPLRTRSARLLGDSKMLERHLRRLLEFARSEGLVDRSLGRDDALRALDLEKYPQPVLGAGPLLVRGSSMAGWAYAGLAAEEVDDLRVDGRLRALLTVENLESFNRHCREARRPDEVVVYTGGFPAGGVLTAIRRLLSIGSIDAVHHWGDIDGGGVAIGRHIERSLTVPVRPHLMEPALAIERGRPVPATDRIDVAGAFGETAAFLASHGAHALEQEVLDPVPIRRDDAT